jgi:uncharacterized protein (DUF1778 family)
MNLKEIHVWTMYGMEDILATEVLGMAKTEKMDRIDLRVTKDQKEVLARAAVLSGLSMSSFLVAKALNEAKKIVSKSESIVLSNRDRDLFYALLKNPPKPNKNLVKLMRDQRK